VGFALSVAVPSHVGGGPLDPRVRENEAVRFAGTFVTDSVFEKLSEGGLLGEKVLPWAAGIEKFNTVLDPLATVTELLDPCSLEIEIGKLKLPFTTPILLVNSSVNQRFVLLLSRAIVKAAAIPKALLEGIKYSTKVDLAGS
jgi:hypothetical protein